MTCRTCSSPSPTPTPRRLHQLTLLLSSLRSALALPLSIVAHLRSLSVAQMCEILYFTANPAFTHFELTDAASKITQDPIRSRSSASLVLSVRECVCSPTICTVRRRLRRRPPSPTLATTTVTATATATANIGWLKLWGYSV